MFNYVWPSTLQSLTHSLLLWLRWREALCLKIPGRFKCWSTAVRGFSWPVKTRQGSRQISPRSSLRSQWQQDETCDDNCWIQANLGVRCEQKRHQNNLISPRLQLTINNFCSVNKESSSRFVCKTIDSYSTNKPLLHSLENWPWAQQLDNMMLYHHLYT